MVNTIKREKGEKMPDEKVDLPSTLKRSPKEAQEIYIKTHISAVKTYGEGESAHRVAFAALKHDFQRVGDHWEKKAQRGPSDIRATKPTTEAIAKKGETFGGIDYLGETKAQLAKRAKNMGVPGTESMTKEEVGKKLEAKLKELDAKERKNR